VRPWRWTQSSAYNFFWAASFVFMAGPRLNDHLQAHATAYGCFLPPPITSFPFLLSLARPGGRADTLGAAWHAGLRWGSYGCFLRFHRIDPDGSPSDPGEFRSQGYNVPMQAAEPRRGNRGFNVG